MKKEQKEKKLRKNSYELKIQPHLDLIKGWRLQGKTMEQISKALGCSRTSLFRFERDHDDLREVLEYSKQSLIIGIEETLFSKALDGDLPSIIYVLNNYGGKMTAKDEAFINIQKEKLNAMKEGNIPVIVNRVISDDPKE